MKSKKSQSRNKGQYSSQEGASNNKNLPTNKTADNIIIATQLGESIKISERCELLNKTTDTGSNITELRIALTHEEYILRNELVEKLQTSCGENKELLLKPISEKAEKNLGNVNLILQYNGRISKFIDNNLSVNQNHEQITNSTQSAKGIARMKLLEKIASILYSLGKNIYALRISEHHFIIDEKYDLKVGMIPYFNYHPEAYVKNQNLVYHEESEYIAALWMNLFLLLVTDSKFRKAYPNSLTFTTENFELYFSNILENYLIDSNFPEDNISLLMFINSIRIILYRKRGFPVIEELLKKVFESNKQFSFEDFPIFFHLEKNSISDKFHNAIEFFSEQEGLITDLTEIDCPSIELIENYIWKMISDFKEIRNFLLQNNQSFNASVSLKQNLENFIYYKQEELKNNFTHIIENLNQQHDLTIQNYINQINQLTSKNNGMENDNKIRQMEIQKEIKEMKTLIEILEKEKQSLKIELTEVNNWKNNLLNSNPILSSNNIGSKDYQNEIMKMNIIIKNKNEELKKLNGIIEKKENQESLNQGIINEMKKKCQRLDDIIHLKIYEINHLENEKANLAKMLMQREETFQNNNSSRCKFNLLDRQKIKEEIEKTYINDILNINKMLKDSSISKDNNDELINSKNEKLNNQNIQIVSEYSDKLNSEIKEKEKLEKELNNSISKLRIELANSESNKMKLIEENKNLIAKYESRISEMNEIISKLHKEKASAINENAQNLTNWKEQMDLLKNQTVISDGKIKELKIEKYNLDKSVLDLIQKLKSKETEINHLKLESENKINNLTNELSSLEKLKTQLESNVKNLTHDYENQVELKDKVNYDLKLKCSNIESLEQKLYKVEGAFNERTNELNISLKNNKDFQSNIIQLENKLKQKNDELEKQKMFNHNSLSKQEKKLQTLKSNNSAKEKEIENLKKTINDNNKKYEENLRQKFQKEGKNKQEVTEFIIYAKNLKKKYEKLKVRCQKNEAKFSEAIKENLLENIKLDN